MCLILIFLSNSMVELLHGILDFQKGSPSSMGDGSSQCSRSTHTVAKWGWSQFLGASGSRAITKICIPIPAHQWVRVPQVPLRTVLMMTESNTNRASVKFSELWSCFWAYCWDFSGWVSYQSSVPSSQHGPPHFWMALQFHNLLHGSHSGHRGTFVCAWCQTVVWGLGGYEPLFICLIWTSYWRHSNSSFVGIHTALCVKCASKCFIFYLTCLWCLLETEIPCNTEQTAFALGTQVGVSAALCNILGFLSFHGLINSTTSLREVRLKCLY